MEENNKLLTQILKTLNEFQVQTTKSINDLREEVRENKREIQKSREIENAHWEENLRLWRDVNDKIRMYKKSNLKMYKNVHR